MSGYDIKRVFTRLDWLIGNISYGGLYPALHALKTDGLVAVEVHTQRGKPSRKVYGITQDGRKTLEQWVNHTAGENGSTRAFVMRLMLADSHSRTGLITQLQQRRAQILSHREALKQDTGSAAEGVEFGQRLALDYGLVLANSELAWLDGKLDRLLKQLPTEGARDN
jgi:DNA-binding PadR family transcriptional regulator